MAKVLPFKAIRPGEGMGDKIPALPYDVYNEKEARAAVQGKPDSFLNIDRPETFFEEGHDMYAPEVYAKANEVFRSMIADGRFITEAKKCYYVYELTMDGRVQTGIVAASSIDDYANGVIKKHENTREEKEQDRIRHVDALSAQTGPIFLAYRSDKTIDSVVEKSKAKDALYDITTEDNIRHRAFIIDDDDDIATLEDAFAKINQIYIADGHHRAASAVKVGFKRREAHPDFDGTEEFNYFLSVLFPHDQLMIMDYNRVVKDLNGLTADELTYKLKDICNLVMASDKEIKPSKKGEFSMYLDGKWYLYAIPEEKIPANDPVKALDVSMLQDYVLNPLLGILDPRTDDRIDFVGGIRGLKELVKRCNEDCKVAFAMYPTQITELFDVADAGLLMPPKSTWFEPKLRSGFFIHEIER
ncbi:MAG: DUF1015 family protein [Lachnospiraceae bacterium]|nr:DUF1015 family protein [Lachnospiraceae bacterium]